MENWIFSRTGFLCVLVNILSCGIEDVRETEKRDREDS